jgi:hypothetical protein
MRRHRPPPRDHHRTISPLPGADNHRSTSGAPTTGVPGAKRARRHRSSATGGGLSLFRGFGEWSAFRFERHDTPPPHLTPPPLQRLRAPPSGHLGDRDRHRTRRRARRIRRGDHRSIFRPRLRSATRRTRRRRKPRHRARARVVRVRLRDGDPADEENTARCQGGENEDHAADDQRWGGVRRGRRWPPGNAFDPLLADGMGQGRRCLEDPCRPSQRGRTCDRLCPGSRNRNALPSERHALDSLSPRIRDDRADLVDRGADRRPWSSARAVPDRVDEAVEPRARQRSAPLPAPAPPE